MNFIPLMLLALAGGVYLLIEVESKGLGRLYKLLSWLVIFLSLLFLTGGIVRGVVHHHRMARRFHEREQFFRNRGPAFGAHPGWGRFGHDMHNKQNAGADSTVNKP